MISYYKGKLFCQTAILASTRIYKRTAKFNAQIHIQRQNAEEYSWLFIMFYIKYIYHHFTAPIQCDSKPTEPNGKSNTE